MNFDKVQLKITGSPSAEEIYHSVEDIFGKIITFKL
jgi:hypothetical protein